VHESKKCLITARGGLSHEDFAAALRSALREDPDCLLVGDCVISRRPRSRSRQPRPDTVFGTSHEFPRKTIDRSSTCPGRPPVPDPHDGPANREGVIAQSLIPTRMGSRGRALKILVHPRLFRGEGRPDPEHHAGRAQHGSTPRSALNELVTSGKITRDEALKRATNPRPLRGRGPNRAGAGAQSVGVPPGARTARHALDARRERRFRMRL